MVQPGFGNGLDTPQTNVGDATYLTRQPDFDFSQELSFQSPSKDNDLLRQLRNGRPGGFSLRTPRSRAPLGDRRNLPAGIGGAEFTPMLKSATRNSAMRGFGKENGGMPNTPALDRINEDITSIPTVETSRYSQNISYVDNTLPQVDTSSAASTPLVLPSRRGEGKGPLQDGKQLSLREQESVIDKIEKENFGLKLKIHFLEEALRKAGPEFNNEALKENTELKVDKVTMQRELQKYKKHLTIAERDLESYRQQMIQVQERAKKKYADKEQLAEMERLQSSVESKEAEIEHLQRQLQEDQGTSAEVDRLQDAIDDLGAELRQKDNLITEQEDQLDDLKAKLDAGTDVKGDLDEEIEDLKTQLREAEEKAKTAERRVLELEQNNLANDELDEAKGTIEDLEHDNRRLKSQVQQMQEGMDTISAAKRQAERDLLEVQEEMVNKSIVTRGSSRQKEERLARLQSELNEADEKFATLEKQLSQAMTENQQLKVTVNETRQNTNLSEQERQSLLNKIEDLHRELEVRLDEKNLLQTRHDALTSESASLQRDVVRLQKSVVELEQGLEQEKEHALQIEKDVRQQYKDEIERLNDEVSDLHAEVRERDNLYDNDSEKWETERQTLQAERDRANDKAGGLEKTIERLREAEGSLSDQENRLQEALRSETERHKGEQASLTRQIQELQSTLETRQSMLSTLRNDLSTTQDQLRQTQVEYQAQLERVEALEDEVEVLQTTLDDESEQHQEELQPIQKECDNLRRQLTILRQSADMGGDVDVDNEPSAGRLQAKLDEAIAKFSAVTQEKENLQDQLASIRVETALLQSSFSKAKAERDELGVALNRLQQSTDSPDRTTRERPGIDSEIRRLKERNAVLERQQATLEKALEVEIDKAAEEEERLNQEILDLRSHVRGSSSADCQEMASSRRTIRTLERRIKELERQLATATHLPTTSSGEDAGEVSMIRRDLAAARDREADLLQREAAHRDITKKLKTQISELERRAHDAEISRLLVSPNSSSASAQRTEVSDLRSQLSSAHQSIHDLKLKARNSERKSSQLERDFQAQFDELAEQKLALEQALEDTQRDADEAVVLHEKALHWLQQKLDKSEYDRKTLASRALHGDSTDRDVQRTLRQTQAETEALKHDIIEQQGVVDALGAAEASLRRKLERARSERAAYRLTVEKLQKDVKELRKAAASPSNQHPVRHSGEMNIIPSDEAIETVIRAAEGAEKRHTKELRGMALQMEWMQARWEREVSMRADSAYAKKFLQLELDVAHACNKAQLRELEQIRTEVLGSRQSLPPPSSTARLPRMPSGRPAFKTVALMARFIARVQMSARAWAKHEGVRKQLAGSVNEMRKAKRRKGLRVIMEDEPGGI